MPRSQPPLSIAEVSRLLSVPAPTLRSWERRYGFPTPPRTTGKHRRYSTPEIELLRALRDEIARGRPARDAVDIVRHHGANRTGSGSENVTRFVEAVVRTDARELVRLLNASTRKLGIEATITQLALPALREIGVRWESGNCSVGHEHLATEQIQTWLHRAKPARPAEGDRVVLACGPDDLHRVGLDAFAVMLAHRDWDVRVLGSQVPSEDLVQVAISMQPDAAVVTSHMRSSRRSAVDSLRKLRSSSDAELFYAGNAFITRASRKGVPGTYLGDDLPEAADLLAKHVRAEAS